ncbi:flagellin [Burkholderia pseudomultivorans]|uniref:Flagellin n=1 Tax=Burkholderia pseudomultivorans TaxID=1207504 RepID=A0ABU2EDJ1_9BURK|nr:flagellin [Burkholderia pseudomultivorans]MDR8730395.1 Flagellin [Burkholderia pseudomultivorans]MDR8736480.1 Flagellin [Burkholderia pseudomultivorans]MDR8744796.1 Flagellin [Burkholderia pseudomultivorans]MDR8757959.1 Flagellin [Burkholderia pseudomultivorans]MDR8779366.1 Flagellin [Burkholderia pseudomultivorans]
MLGINSNINSLVAQQNLNGSQNALSQAITRLSSGKRINSAADDAAGLAISTRMQTQINGLNQGVSNANDGVSMIQTATSGLSQITSSLQRIRQLAVQASSGSLSTSDQQALQQEVTQQIAEVNRIASQTNYNGKNVLDGSAGNISFQVGANVGQTINLNLTQSLSAASLGTGLPTKGSTLGQLTGLSLDSSGQATTGSATPAVTTINILADGKGGFQFTDQNNQALSSTAVTNLFGSTTAGSGTALALTAAAGGALGTITSTPPTGLTTAQQNQVAAINTANKPNGTDQAGRSTAGTLLGTVTGLSLDSNGGYIAPNESGATVSAIQVFSDGNGGFTFADQNGNALSASGNVVKSVFTGTVESSAATTGTTGGAQLTVNTATAVGTTTTNATIQGAAVAGAINSANLANVPPRVADIDISTTAGANQAMESIDNALATVNNIQASLGAAQNRFTAISTTQQAQATNLSQAQSQIQDANFAQETANLSKAQVLQQAGISVLAQANSLPQQVLKLLQ